MPPVRFRFKRLVIIPKTAARMIPQIQKENQRNDKAVIPSPIKANNFTFLFSVKQKAKTRKPIRIRLGMIPPILRK